MSSLIEGYNYDIFISYRQKDNKGDRWVSEFVEALKTELESTFKEEISVYFDINPSDYLLESYDVDASLKVKLKCLVFIPIISRTYCDPKSFAWEHEFKTFVELASQDQFGLKVKLPNGNVASRVLPVRIHDLDAADIKECESVLGGVLRGVEFIYKEAGIDKPLTPDDDEKKNLNNTKYRIQIIKVAHAIKEIILGMKAEPAMVVEEKGQPRESFKEVREEGQKVEKARSSKAGKVKFLSVIAFFALLLIAVILAYPKIFKRNTLEKSRSSGERISVAVMPFQNMTNDTLLNVWKDGIQNELINNLTNSEELQVKQIESITDLIKGKGLTNTASLTPSVASTISKKLNANVFIYGSIKQVGNTIRVNTQLIDSKTKEIFKSFQIDGAEEEIFDITDSLSAMLRDFLVISIMEKEIIKDFRLLISSNSSEAYRYYMYGNQAFYKYDYPAATEWYRKAIGIDSSFTEAIRMLSFSLAHQGLNEESRKWMLRNYEKRDQMSDLERLWAEIMHAETSDEVIKYFKLLIAYDEEMPVPHSNLAFYYLELKLYDKAITEFEKELEIYKKWGSKPRWSAVYTSLGYAYHMTGQYKKEKKLYMKGLKDFPDDPYLYFKQSILAFTLGKTNEANKYVEKSKSIRKNKGESEADIVADMTQEYFQYGMLDQAKEYCRELLSLRPVNPDLLNLTAHRLLNDNRTLNEVLELAERVLTLNPEDHIALHRKGWALYKLGRYDEALELMLKSRDIRVEKNLYDQEFYLHLDSVKSAVARQKNN